MGAQVNVTQIQEFHVARELAGVGSLITIASVLIARTSEVNKLNYSTSCVEYMSLFEAPEGGQCNQNANCQSNLLCDGNAKICRKESADLGSYDPNFCSQNLCQEGEGDCDDDTECDGSLECGTDNCPTQNNWPTVADCCYQP